MGLSKSTGRRREVVRTELQKSKSKKHMENEGYGGSWGYVGFAV